MSLPENIQLHYEMLEQETVQLKTTWKRKQTFHLPLSPQENVRNFPQEKYKK